MAISEHIKWLLEGVESWNLRRERQDFNPDLSGVNIFEEFVKDGKLDSDGNIPLSKVNFSGTNLYKSYLSTPNATNGADLTHANLWSANLRDAQLANSRLDGANLCGTRFDHANLLGASLRDVRTASTGFRGANLFQADLTGAKMGNAYLGNANLSCAKIEGTDLSAATLTGANLSWSRPWEAKLYGDSHSMAGPNTQAGHNQRITSVAKLIEECEKLETQSTNFQLYFRGEHQNRWKLQPSVMRDNSLNLRAKESDMLLDLMSRRPEDFNDTISALAQWVLAQHHKLKTRLLDITRNPLVALFGSCKPVEEIGRLHVFSVPKELVKPFNSNTISVITNFSKLTRADQNLLVGWTASDIKKRETDPQFSSIYGHAIRRLYHLIRQEKPFFEERIDPRDFFRVFVVEPQQSFERVRAQSGAFLISAFHERFERNEVLKWNSGIPIYNHSTFEVPKNNKQQILKELRLLNVTRETLYPGLDEAALAVTQYHSK